MIAQRSAAESAVVEAALRKRSERALIIAFADSRYLDVLMNWLVGLARSGIDNYLVIALDRPLYEFLAGRGIPSVFSPLHGDLSALWVRRINIFSALCAAGIDFIHSDVDAVWMRDPLEFLDNPDIELTFSQGTIWPPDVHQRFGFVLCCGLFQLRSGPAAHRLLGELEQHVLLTGDDQVSLNRLIAARSVEWRIEPRDTYHVEGSGKRFLCARSLMRGVSADGLRITVLPHHLFQRVPMSTDEDPYVLHPLTRKDPVVKLAEFARQGCLLLRPDWRTVDFDAQSLRRLQRDG